MDRLLDLPRDRSAVSAVRDTATGEWAHLTWSELLAGVRRAAGGAGERGDGRSWSAHRGGGQLVTDLALQFAGVVGELRGDGAGVGAAGDDPGRLVRMRQDVRPRDPAVRTGAGVLDHAAVAETASRLCHRLAPAPGLLPTVVMSTADAATEQALGWACVWGGLTLVCSDSTRVNLTNPDVWVCVPDQLAAAVPVTRSRLRAVFVVGQLPAPARSWRDVGVDVREWAA